MIDCFCPEYPINLTTKTMTIAPDERYDHEEDAHCSHEANLRMKFIGLGLVKLWVFSPLQISYRLYDLLSGGFYVRGYANAQHAHFSLKERTAVPICSIVYYVLIELIKDVSKIILFPLYLISLAFSCAIGVFCVELGRRMFSRIDRFWYVHPKDPDTYSRCEAWTNLAAPCMQTKEFRKEANLFRYGGNYYHSQTLHSLYNRFQNLLNKASCYFDVIEIRTALANYRDLHLALNATYDSGAAETLNNGKVDKNKDLRMRLRYAINNLENTIIMWADNTNNHCFNHFNFVLKDLDPNNTDKHILDPFKDPYSIRV